MSAYFGMYHKVYKTYSGLFETKNNNINTITKCCKNISSEFQVHKCKHGFVFVYIPRNIYIYDLSFIIGPQLRVQIVFSALLP